MIHHLSIVKRLLLVAIILRLLWEYVRRHVLWNRYVLIATKVEGISCELFLAKGLAIGLHHGPARVRELT